MATFSACVTSSSIHLVRAIPAALAPGAVLVPMDGFHLAQTELTRLGIDERKGAIDTFDAGGYTSLIRRLRRQTEQVIYAPVFRRDLEEAIAGAIPVPVCVPLVITEGNYLLADAGGWQDIAGLLDEVWYLEPGEESRIEWLIRRHVAFGRDRHSAEERALGGDQRNAELIRRTRGRADVIVPGTFTGPPSPRPAGAAPRGHGRCSCRDRAAGPGTPGERGRGRFSPPQFPEAAWGADRGRGWRASPVPAVDEVLVGAPRSRPPSTG